MTCLNFGSAVVLKVYVYCMFYPRSILGPIVGHVGDGNFHVFYPVHPDDTETMNKVHEVSHKMSL